MFNSLNENAATKVKPLLPFSKFLNLSRPISKQKKEEAIYSFLSQKGIHHFFDVSTREIERKLKKGDYNIPYRPSTTWWFASRFFDAEDYRLGLKIKEMSDWADKDGSKEGWVTFQEIRLFNEIYPKKEDGFILVQQQIIKNSGGVADLGDQIRFIGVQQLIRCWLGQSYHKVSEIVGVVLSDWKPAPITNDPLWSKYLNNDGCGAGSLAYDNYE